jgi:AraC-like DNA-binding protein
MMAILVSKRMRRSVNAAVDPRLERSCAAAPGDWIRAAPPHPGIERIEAFFAGHAYDPHRHDTYAIGRTLAGVQSFDYRGARADSMRGHAIILHPDERHDGRAGAPAGFRYRMLYIAPRLVRDALGRRARSLPFARQAVSDDPRLLGALRPALGDLERPWEALEADQVILGIADALLALDPTARGHPDGTACAIAVERARQLLDDEFARVVASEELEAATGLDRYTLARQFRKRLGTSPYRYLTLRRLDHARALMRAGHGLADTAAASGFADQGHMTRRFRQAYGLPPGRWRAIETACRCLPAAPPDGPPRVRARPRSRP